MRVTDTASFIAKSKTVHGDRYDYSKSIYLRSREKIEIICKEHGSFWQLANSHLEGKNCPKCASNSTKDNSYFLVKAKEKHGDKYDYSNAIYVNRNEKLEIICRKHGSFWQTPTNHYAGKGCFLCRNESTGHRCRKDYDLFLSQANLIHKGKYKYIEKTYVNAKTKMDIICNTHGVFKQSPNKHLQGRGCRKCFYDGNKHLWSYSLYQRRCDEVSSGLSKIYLIKCQLNSEEFYKIGVSIYGAHSRFDRHSKMPYKFIVISEIEMTGNECLINEKKLKELCFKFSYSPKIQFHGYTECFSELTQEVKDFFGVQDA